MIAAVQSSSSSPSPFSLPIASTGQEFERMASFMPLSVLAENCIPKQQHMQTLKNQNPQAITECTTAFSSVSSPFIDYDHSLHSINAIHPSKVLVVFNGIDVVPVYAVSCKLSGKTFKVISPEDVFGNLALDIMVEYKKVFGSCNVIRIQTSFIPGKEIVTNKNNIRIGVTAVGLDNIIQRLSHGAQSDLPISIRLDRTKYMLEFLKPVCSYLRQSDIPQNVLDGALLRNDVLNIPIQITCNPTLVPGRVITEQLSIPRAVERVQIIKETNPTPSKEDQPQRKCDIPSPDDQDQAEKLSEGSNNIVQNVDYPEENANHVDEREMEKEIETEAREVPEDEESRLKKEFLEMVPSAWPCYNWKKDYRGCRSNMLAIVYLYARKYSKWLRDHNRDPVGQNALGSTPINMDVLHQVQKEILGPGFAEYSDPQINKDLDAACIRFMKSEYHVSVVPHNLEQEYVFHYRTSQQYDSIGSTNVEHFMHSKSFLSRKRVHSHLMEQGFMKIFTTKQLSDIHKVVTKSASVATTIDEGQTSSLASKRSRA